MLIVYSRMTLAADLRRGSLAAPKLYQNARPAFADCLAKEARAGLGRRMRDACESSAISMPSGAAGSPALEIRSVSLGRMLREMVLRKGSTSRQLTLMVAGAEPRLKREDRRPEGCTRMANMIADARQARENLLRRCSARNTAGLFHLINKPMQDGNNL